MVRPRHTARKSTGRLPVGQLAPRDVLPQQEPQHDSPHEEEPFEIVVVAHERQEPQGALAEEPQPLQNNDHNNNHSEEEEEQGNKAEGEDDDDYTLLSDAENDKMFCDADEIKTFGNEAPILTGRLKDLLNYLNITTPPEFRIKRVPCPGREEYKAIMEIFNGPNVVSCHKGPTFRTPYQDAVADAAW
jgi:hypothetical protein